MTFYERYAAIAEKQGLDPCSQKAADLFGLTKATISVWNVKGTTPKGETVATMADMLGVSADYLLGRTDDPTDYARKTEGPATPEATVVQRIRSIQPPAISKALMILYNKLDETDKLKIEGVIQGMLMQDKYIPAVLPNAAHTRTDIQPTRDMVEHDEDIMDEKNF